MSYYPRFSFLSTLTAVFICFFLLHTCAQATLLTPALASAHTYRCSVLHVSLSIHLYHTSMKYAFWARRCLSLCSTRQQSFICKWWRILAVLFYHLKYHGGKRVELGGSILLTTEQAGTCGLGSTVSVCFSLILNQSSVPRFSQAVRKESRSKHSFAGSALQKRDWQNPQVVHISHAIRASTYRLLNWKPLNTRKIKKFILLKNISGYVEL